MKVVLRHGDVTETVDIEPVTDVALLDMADKSDPLNQLLCVGIRVGDLSAKVTIERSYKNWNDDRRQIQRGIAALFEALADHAPQVRDEIAKLRGT